eukprot:TRINITY_DN2609_c0_g1_i3.p1 TRINITY_DN2609_c0_g1~~TRINITY_DN2609_c0_g1_i3.p1  ORF type:complete len:330 (-),score=74.23 TRINITY_DN2609_c0_g1_i3:58-1047(-)
MSIPLLTAEVECRNCHELMGGEEEMISPCLCSGSIKYVHRRCLDQWRAYSPNQPRSFYYCDVCGFQYRLQEKPEMRASRIRRFILYVLRDFIGAMLLMQFIIALLASITFAADRSDGKLRKVFPETWPQIGTFYVWGLFWFSLLASLYGLLLLLVWACSSTKRNVSYNTYPYGWGYYYLWFWNPNPGCGQLCPLCDCSCCCCSGGGGGGGGCGSCGCHCSGSGCGGGSSGSSNNGSGMGLMAIIILVLAVVIGLIVIVVIASLIISKHMGVLKRLQDTRELEVVDLSDDNNHHHHHHHHNNNNNNNNKAITEAVTYGAYEKDPKISTMV